MAGYNDTREWRHLYGRRWKRVRVRHLAKEPLCRYCLEQKRLTPATVVDHIKEHKGDVSLFWDPANHQSLCDPHHNSTKQAMERSGRAPCGADGYPTDGGW